MKKITLVSLTSYLFMFLCSAVAYVSERLSFRAAWVPLLIGVAVIVGVFVLIAAGGGDVDCDCGDACECCDCFSGIGESDTSFKSGRKKKR